jgi:hypothetical protein
VQLVRFTPDGVEPQQRELVLPVLFTTSAPADGHANVPRPKTPAEHEGGILH